MLRTVISFAGCALALAAAGCGSGGSDASIRLAATTPPAADLVRAVAGDRAAVTALLPLNADPHDYEPRPSDARAVAEADAIFRSGGDLDDWTGELVEGAGAEAPVLHLIDAVDTIEAGGEADPHWWHDPRNAVKAVAAIRDELSDIDPSGDAVYERNAAAYSARITKLDERIAACIRRIPRERRRLVTSHDALGYFAERYGLEVVGSTIPALTTQAQPSAGETAELIDLIRERDVPAVFPEAGVGTRLERAIARETGARVGDELYADTLGPQGSPGDTYLGALAANARRISAGLGGSRAGCEIEP
ncbi:MAG TPA: metal ABC transporter substrate-binding protein [Thermoleophilaceae bacterium]|nr:metal ABC transporter substrate-binding protein [Thermoleophilaceae bacterium]